MSAGKPAASALTPRQLGRQPLVGVEMELPLVLQRQIVDRPVALRAVVLEGVLDDAGAGGGGDLQRLVGAAGIDHMDVVGDAPGAASVAPIVASALKVSRTTERFMGLRGGWPRLWLPRAPAESSLMGQGGRPPQEQSMNIQTPRQAMGPLIEALRHCWATGSRPRRPCASSTATTSPITRRMPPDAVAFAQLDRGGRRDRADLRRQHGVPVIAFGTGTSLEGHVAALQGGVSHRPQPDEQGAGGQRRRSRLPGRGRRHAQAAERVICATPACSSRSIPAPTPRSAAWPRRAPRAPTPCATARCARTCWASPWCWPTAG